MANVKKTIKEAIDEARSSWSGSEGDRRAETIKNFIDKKLKEYSEKLEISKEELWNKWETERNVNVVNWYQEANYPELSADILILETVNDFKSKFPSCKSICPSCEKHTRGYTRCENCDWRAYGLFSTLSKGVQVLIKETVSKPYWIFKPIELP